jgi:hypothetical protein
MPVRKSSDSSRRHSARSERSRKTRRIATAITAAAILAGCAPSHSEAWERGYRYAKGNIAVWHRYHAIDLQEGNGYTPGLWCSGLAMQFGAHQSGAWINAWSNGCIAAIHAKD